MVKASGVEPGQRRLNGPQTTGRTYRNLSQPQFATTRENNVPATMRDGSALLADVIRPDAPGRFPVLVAASPYPRQMQDLGAPLGFIEAGQSDFFVPRGYVHVIANCRGTGGSGGKFGFSDAQERRDMHDLVEWAAAQPWSDGNVGMVGISYFASTQIMAAVERPPHLKAIMPIALTADLYHSSTPGGLFSSALVTPFLAMVGLASKQPDALWRSKLVSAAKAVMHVPAVHDCFATMNGEAALAGLRKLLGLPHDPHPWDDLWRAMAVEHPFRDGWWEERNLLPLLDRVEVPVYLGCDWQNVPLHLPQTFPALAGLTNSPNVRVAVLDEYGLTWPWESLHVEALAWYDQWLKGQDTGILEGPMFRYVLPGEGEWHAAEAWPVPARYKPFALGPDGTLNGDADTAGERQMMSLGIGFDRPHASESDPPAVLTWTSAPLEHDTDVVGPVELRVDATHTAPDTAWIVILQDVAPDGSAHEVTAAYLRAGLRRWDEATSREGAPVLPCDRFEPLPIGVPVAYRIPLVPIARRFAAGHRIRLLVTANDQDPDVPALMNFRHAGAGTSCLTRIFATSTLLLPWT